MLSFPVKSNEEYKYTDLSHLSIEAFRSEKKVGKVPAEFIKQKLHTGALNFVFIDGVFSAAHSAKIKSDDRIFLSTTQEALAKNSVAQKFFATLGHNSRDMLSPELRAIHHATLTDGMFIALNKNVIFTKPINLVFISTDESTGIAPYNLIALDTDSKLSLFENYYSYTVEDAKNSATKVTAVGPVYNSLNQVTLYAGSELQHIKLHDQSLQTTQLYNLIGHISKDAFYHSTNFVLGSSLTRNNIFIELYEDARASLDGLYLAGAKQHLDNHTALVHKARGAISSQNYKGVLGGKATAVFNGKVIIEKHAVQTKAHQSNRNILLTPKAAVYTKPELQIYADDVECKHGATVGAIDENALFYLRARGLDLATARTILLESFAGEIIEKAELLTEFDNYYKKILGTKLVQLQRQAATNEF